MSGSIKEIVALMNEIAPEGTAEPWDNVGLLIGHKNQEVKKALVALDATDQVIEEAITKKVDLIITHHPVIFKGIQKINGHDPTGRKIIWLIENGIGLYSAHTNLDKAWGGTNDVLAKLLEVKNLAVLDPETERPYKKISVYVPESHEAVVREAMLNGGAGHIGGYSHCSFRQPGTGTFLPEAGATPYIGHIGRLEEVREIKIETIVHQSGLQNVVEAMCNAHPYEEPAYDVYPLENTAGVYGIGRIGRVDPVSFAAFVEKAKTVLGLSVIKAVGPKDKMIQTVALCTGSGMEYLKTAQNKNADVFVTADIRYHDAQKALDMGIALLDGTHYATEQIVVKPLAEAIQKKAAEKNISLEICTSDVDGQVFSYL